MAEVLGAASAVLAIMDAVCGMIERINDAHERQKNLPALLDHHMKELYTTKTIIQTVKEEQALQTAAVASELLSMEKILRKLADSLEVASKPAKNKGTLRRLSIHLIRGSKDEKALSHIMAELSQSKDNLSLKIQVANVGLLRSVQGTVVANAKVVAQINHKLQGTLGKGWELKMAQLLQGRSPQEDGTVPLSEDDLSFLAGNEANSRIDSELPPYSPEEANPQSRVVIANTTHDQALQINGPIGEKGWREVSHLRIEQNTASGASIQINHGTSMEVFEKLLAARAASAKA